VSPLKIFYNIGEQIQVDCMDGLEGGTHWTCLEEGTWEAVLPDCSPGCAPPPVDNAHPPVIEVQGSTMYYTYTCLEGYTVLNESTENYTLSCTEGQLDAEEPICTRVEIRSPSHPHALTLDNGTFYYDMEEGANQMVLTCGLEGVDQYNPNDYPTQWMLPKKSNGEIPPGVEIIDDFRLYFRQAYPAQAGEYVCNISNVTASVVVRVGQATGKLIERCPQSQCAMISLLVTQVDTDAR
jgi:hypothetical protein